VSSGSRAGLLHPKGNSAGRPTPPARFSRGLFSGGGSWLPPAPLCWFVQFSQVMAAAFVLRSRRRRSRLRGCKFGLSHSFPKGNHFGHQSVGFLGGLASSHSQSTQSVDRGRLMHTSSAVTHFHVPKRNPPYEDRVLEIARLTPANCGFERGACGKSCRSNRGSRSDRRTSPGHLSPLIAVQCEQR